MEGFTWFKKIGEAKRVVDTTLDTASERVANAIDLDTEMVMTRREMLEKGAKIAGGAFVAGTAAGIGIDTLMRDTPNDTVESELEHLPDKGELFARVREGYRKAYTTLDGRHVQFIDDDGDPVDKPVAMEPYKGISPGTFDANGVLIGQLNQAWLDQHRRDICEKHPNVTLDIREGEPRFWNFAGLLRDANAAEPELHAQSLKDIAIYNAKKPVVGIKETISRLEYIKKYAASHIELSPLMASELSSLAPALAAQESQYNQNSDSGKAKGILQFRDAEWSSLGYSEDSKKYLTKQTEAMSRLLQGKFAYLNEHLKTEFNIIESRYFSTRAEFEKYFLMPVLINSYNSGEGNLTNVVKWFTERFGDKESLMRSLRSTTDDLGYDVYTIMSRMGRKEHASPSYGRDSSQYFLGIKAWQQILGT